MARKEYICLKIPGSGTAARKPLRHQQRACSTKDGITGSIDGEPIEIISQILGYRFQHLTGVLHIEADFAPGYGHRYPKNQTAQLGR
jgi:hypothetical protein